MPQGNDEFVSRRALRMDLRQRGVYVRNSEGVTLLNTPAHITNSLNAIFPRVASIRRHINEFEDRLADRYGQPQTIPVPDDLDPQVPRVLFHSKNGHSQIVVSQVSIALNVNYDNEWTTEAAKRLAYLQDRVPLVYELCQIADAKPSFTGLTGRVRLTSDESDAETLRHLVSVLGVSHTETTLNELSVRLSNTVDDRFFDNVTIQSYREWKQDGADSTRRLRVDSAISRGIEIIQDYNDRFAFNEVDGYETSEKVALEIVARAQESLEAWIERVQKG